MPRVRQSVSDTVSWLSFPRQAYPNFYLNVQTNRAPVWRLSRFNQRVQRVGRKSGKANAKVSTIFLEAGIELGRGGRAEICVGPRRPTSKSVGPEGISRHSGRAPHRRALGAYDRFVLARGRGGLVYPNHVASSSAWHEGDISPGVVAEIAAEQQRQTAIGTSADPEPLYCALYMRIPTEGWWSVCSGMRP
jgi:hypothetical protein